MITLIKVLNEDFMNVFATEEEMIEFWMHFWSLLVNYIKSRVVNLFIMDLRQ